MKYEVISINYKKTPWELVLRDEDQKILTVRDNTRHQYNMFVGTNFYGILAEDNDLFEYVSGDKKIGSILELERYTDSDFRRSPDGYPEIYVKLLAKWQRVHTIIKYNHYLDKLPNINFGIEYFELDHEDRNKDNNFLTNLRFITKLENSWRELDNGNPNGAIYVAEALKELKTTKNNDFIDYALKKLAEEMKK
jgi:hypothetical protein